MNEAFEINQKTKFDAKRFATIMTVVVGTAAAVIGTIVAIGVVREERLKLELVSSDEG